MYGPLMQKQRDIMVALFKAAEAENRAFTDEEQTNYDAAEVEFNRLKNLSDQSDKLENMKDSIPATKAQVPAKVSASKSQAALEGELHTDNKAYKNFGTMLLDVAASANGNSEARERLVNASLNTETGTDGGFLIPEEFIADLMEMAEEQSQIYSRARKIKLTIGNTANIPGVDEKSRADGQRHGGIVVYWVAEGQEGTYSQPKFRNLDIKLSKLMGLVKVSSEMMEDSALLASWIQSAFPEEMSFALDLAAFSGDGNGKPLGILESDALVTVPKESGQANNTIVYENIVKMWARMSVKHRLNAVWYVCLQAEEQLPLMALNVGTGGMPVYLPPGGASTAPYGTLFGRPVIPIEQASALGQVGDIVLAGMNDYLAVEKGNVKVDTSIHVDFDKDLQSFRFIKRCNAAPYTKTKLQSRESATFYTSPYIALAARTA